MKITITGKSQVLQKLKSDIDKKQKATQQGMRAATLLVKGVSLPLTPHESGHLRESCYTDVKIKGSFLGLTSAKVVGIIGYTADYAVYVHERTELHHEPPTQAKFLETAIKQTENEIIGLMIGKLRPA